MRLIVALLLAATVGCGCSESNHASDNGDAHHASTADAHAAATVDSGPPADATIMPTVTLMPEGKPEVRVTVALARTSEEQRRGLMYVQHLPVDAGMLFLMGGDAVQSFWMKNTLIPLDMIFIRADGTVAGVVESAEPKTLTSRSVGRISRHVLEVNGGFAKAHGIGEGTRVTYEHVDMTGFDK